MTSERAQLQHGQDVVDIETEWYQSWNGHSKVKATSTLGDIVQEIPQGNDVGAGVGTVRSRCHRGQDRVASKMELLMMGGNDIGTGTAVAQPRRC